ncbi:divergent PAP2 family protein [soil metagenome]|nr:divergent PAP2 family protein [Gemmatimonadota bacterium]
MTDVPGAAYGAILRAIAWNPPLLLALLAMMTAQAFKFGSALLVRRRVDFTRLLGTGGMPSSHSASVTAMSTAVGIEQGWNSTIFGVAAFISLVIMYDATGIRRAAGRQAQVLNRVLEDLKDYHKLQGERLKELLGHTPLEVLVGAAYGAFVAFLFHP